jgi:hypothetical protein
MTNIEAINQLNEPDFLREIELALVKIGLPLAADDTHPAHNYAKLVINNSEAFVRRFGLAILADTDLSKVSKKQITDPLSDQVFDTHIDLATSAVEASIAKWFAAFAS